VQPRASTSMPVRDRFGTLPGGEPVDRWTLTDEDRALTASVLTLGATLQSLRLPDARGRYENVVLGFDSLDDYLHRSPYFGATVGRYANRIAGGRMTLDGVRHRLPLNDPPRPNTLHGGPGGFSTRLWQAEPLDTPDGCAVELTLTSPDGDQGFPGTVRARVRYTLAGGELRMEYEASTDAATVVNLTNHAYLNLAGEGAGTVLDHRLTLAAAAYLPVDAALIPTAAGPAPVHGTPFDLTRPRLLSDALLAAGADERSGAADGFDHCWLLDGGRTARPRPVARLAHPASGRTVDLLSTEPGIQVYTGNGLDGTLTGPSGRSYARHSGIALETQALPDSPNRPDFPSTVLRPGEIYRSTTILRAGAR
jgi:aldose 1-epimerase